MKLKAAAVFIMAAFFFPALCIPADTQAGDSALIELMEEARDLQNRAAAKYDEGDLKEAGKLYNQAIKKLYSANLDPETSRKLNNEFNILFAKIFEILKGTAANCAAPAAEPGVKDSAVLIDKDNPVARKYIGYYTQGSGKKRIEEALARSGEFRDMILAQLKESKLPEELVYLPVAESLYKINAYSSAGASGLWQLMTRTGRGLGLEINYWVDERRDPEKATRAALRFLNELYLLFNDWHLALAAYNRGENGIGRDLQFSKASNYGELGNRKAIPKETEDFVPKFMACALIGANPGSYGLCVKYAPPRTYDTVKLNKPVDLEIAANCAGTSVAALRQLNPSISAWCTPPNYPDFELKLPAGTKDAFLGNVAKVADLNPSRGFVKYKVKKGDFLEKIANKFHTSISIIREDNKIKNANLLAVGRTLTIRPGRKYFKSSEQ